VALEVEQSTIEVNIVVTHSGEKLLTFSAFPNDQWVIYTPEGYWDGSASVHEYVKFYRKDKLLDVRSAERFRGRDKIDAVLAMTSKLK
jgi:hypothetical protein